MTDATEYRKLSYLYCNIKESGNVILDKYLRSDQTPKFNHI